MLRVVTGQFLRGQRVDVTVVARELGVGRATIYRWFGSREALLGEVVANQLQTLIAATREQVTVRGAVGLLEVFDRINRSLATSPALRRLLEQERTVAMRLLTSSDGIVQPRAVSCVEALIDAEVSAGTFDPPADPATLAYAIVRLAEAFLYNDAAIGIRGDHERLREVEAALLGVAAPAPKSAGSRELAPESGRSRALAPESPGRAELAPDPAGGGERFPAPPS